jgi:hypothetical protein
VPTFPNCLESNVTLSVSRTRMRLALAAAIHRRLVDGRKIQEKDRG